MPPTGGIAGAIGTGETHLEIALGDEAAWLRYRLAFVRTADPIRDRLDARDEPPRPAALEKAQLLPSRLGAVVGVRHGGNCGWGFDAVLEEWTRPNAETAVKAQPAARAAMQCVPAASVPTQRREIGTAKRAEANLVVCDSGDVGDVPSPTACRPHDARLGLLATAGPMRGAAAVDGGGRGSAVVGHRDHIASAVRRDEDLLDVVYEL